MYNVLVVDDDALFATAFINNYPWEEQGFRFLGHAKSGAAALWILHHNPVDIAFVDMCMPEMNGPEVISWIKKNYPATVCVALSNYDDFDFVKESFRAGAMDYVLKHCLNRNEVKRILDAFFQQVKPAQSPSATGASEADPMSVSVYMTALLEGRIVQDGDDYTLPDSLRIARLSDNLLVIRTQITNFKAFQKKYFEASRLKYILRTICSILLNVLEHHTKGVVFYSDGDECFYSILTDERFSDLHFLNYTQELYIRQVSATLKMYLNADCSSMAAPLVAKVCDLRRAYLHLCAAFDRASRPVEQMRGIDSGMIYAHALKTLERCMNSPNFDDTRRYIANQYENARRLQYHTSQFGQLSVVLYRVYLAVKDDSEPSEAAVKEYLTLFESKNIREMEEFIIGLFSRLYGSRKADCQSECSRYVQEAVKIIQRRYDTPSLSLSTIAPMVNVSDSYLSRSFKSEMGMGISEYINRYRVERAQSMLIIDRMSVKDASTRCGFDNYTYFFRIFKKITGLTPKEFREKYDLSVNKDGTGEN
ncbi:MAG: helix-turn-helix domain-containing protein [Clostridia bacterium]|nr:helix-turn-helix domain-containing protein [Clostridia bacterium]